MQPGNKLTSAAGSAAVDGALAMRPPTAQLDMKSVDRVPRRNLINTRDPRLAKLLDARSQILSVPVASPEGVAFKPLTDDHPATLPTRNIFLYVDACEAKKKIYEAFL